jgi:uncharacterized protein YPO0396
MKLLTRLLLVNWHFYSVERIDFAHVNFLTGKTGSGKSTVVDALQIVLLGDTNGQHFFNKAANDRSRRTLKGYLRGEYGDDGGSGYLYLRNGPFTSYIVCQFHDTEKKTDLSLGVVFDCNYSAHDESVFFVLKAAIPADAFIAEDVALEIRDFRQYLRHHFERDRFDVCATAREYQNKLTGLLGGLNNRYFSLFRKAVSFTPIIDIEAFITENICDSRRPPDLSGMQENLRQYRRLEQEAEQMRRRIADLEAISGRFANLQEEKQKRRLYQFLIDRAELENQVLQHHAALAEAEQTERDLAALVASGEALDQELARQRTSQEALIEQRGQNDIYQRQQALTREKQQIEARLAELQSQLEALVRRLNTYGLQWRQAGSETQTLLTDLALAQTALDLPEWRGDADCRKAADQLLDAAGQLIAVRRDTADQLTRPSLEHCQQTAEAFARERARLLAQLEQLREQTGEELEDCEDRIADLKRNVKPFDGRVSWFRDELTRVLAEQFGRPVRVAVLADLLDIPNPRWINVIEGYLHKQKQYLLVEPEAYAASQLHYNRLRQERNLFDVSLIDGAKVEALAPQALPGSLAEEVATDQPQARAYIDYLLGRVIKCEQVQDLRLHERAVTDQGLLYQGYVTGSINPRLWEFHLIGKRAIQQQIERLEHALPGLRQRHEQIGVLAKQALASRSLAVMSENETADLVSGLERSAGIADLQAAARSVASELGQLDLSWILKLSRQIDDLRQVIQTLETKLRAQAEQAGRLRRQSDWLEQSRIPELSARLAALQSDLNQRYEAVFRSGPGEQRFQAELAGKQTPDKISADFRSQVGMRQNAIDGLERELTNARAAYNRAYNYSFDVAAPDNRRYETQLQALRAEQLPQYKEQIETARQMAYEQFASHFLAEMKASIEEVRLRIDELNRALRQYRWGEERFSFQMTENQEYKRFYDMINDPMLMEGYNIMSQLFLDKHGAAIDELFNRIVDLGPAMDSDARSELEKNIHLFTDYKTYLRFDMISVDEQEHRQRLSRTLLKKSGGETQTPFYIAMLASFAQLYHINDRKWNCSRLIIFDEAFSKMDGERIRESIQMLKQIGFQCILSAPPEKIGDIAPLVDRNIAVIRHGHSALTRNFDTRQLLDLGDDAEDEAEDEADG